MVNVPDLTFGMIGAAALAAASCSPGKDTENQRPNILCIVCEDIGPFLGCYGDSVAVTPNLDRLASESVRYTQMHTCVGVSSPSRFSLITGMYSSAMGANYMRTLGDSEKFLPEGITPYEVVPPPGVRCYSEYMRAAGYYCTNGPKTDYQFIAPVTAWDECGKRPDFLSRPEGMPFFSIINLGVTHESQIWERSGLPLAVDPSEVEVPPYYPDTPTVRHDLAVLYSNIAEMDRQSGEILDTLRSCGEIDNTIVIWYSDNGGPMPRGKREIYTSGTRVPFMIRYPDGKKAGTVENRLCMFVDIPATILSLAGIKPPSYMHGKPFAGKWNSRPRKYVYGARDRMDEKVDKQGGIFDGRYHYIRNYMPERPCNLDCAYQNNIPSMQEMAGMFKRGELDPVQARWFSSPRPEVEFYDELNDPYEIHDISGMKATGTYKRLERNYNRWIRRYNRAWFIPESETYVRFLPGGEKMKTSPPLIQQKGKRVEIKINTPGSSVNYRITPPGAEAGRWMLYTGAFAAEKGSVVEAVADRAGYEKSPSVLLQIN